MATKTKKKTKTKSEDVIEPSSKQKVSAFLMSRSNDIFADLVIIGTVVGLLVHLKAVPFAMGCLVAGVLLLVYAIWKKSINYRNIRA